MLHWMKKACMAVVTSMMILSVLMLVNVDFVSMKAQAAAVKVNKGTKKLAVGESIQIKFKNANAQLQWKSYQPQIAVVDETGTITAKKVGTAKVAAKYKNKYLIYKIRVKKGKYTIPSESIVRSDAACASMKIKTAAGEKEFFCWDQKVEENGGTSKTQIKRMKETGCTSCVLASVVKAYSGKKYYQNCTPASLRFELMKDKTNNGLWVYKRIPQYFRRAGVTYEKGILIDDTQYCQKITEQYLYNGHPMIVLLYNEPRDADVTPKQWTGYLHSVVLLGYTEEGKIVLADSITRDWGGAYQRFRAVDPKEVYSCMGRSCWTTYYAVM